MAMFKTIFLLAAISVALIPSAYGFSRIVGGVQTTIEKRPYLASLQFVNNGVSYHICGGSIISSKFILSSAQCTPENNMNIFYARVGSSSFLSGGQLIKVAKFEGHPDYKRYNLDYDFAIVTLQSAIVMGPTTAVMKLVDNSNPADGELLTVSGWGWERQHDGFPAQYLREVNLPVMNQDICRNTYFFISSRQICLGGSPQGMLGVCKGDSGSPAVKNGIQYATVSGGDGCEKPNVPFIFGRITAVRSWISGLTGI